MASVISDKVCNYCNYENAMIDYYYKTDEEFFFCPRCGSSYSHSIKNIENLRKNIDIEPEFEDKENKAEHAIRYGDNVYSCGSITGEDIEQFCDFVTKNKFQTGQYTFQKDGKWFIKDIVNVKVIAFAEQN